MGVRARHLVIPLILFSVLCGRGSSQARTPEAVPGSLPDAGRVSTPATAANEATAHATRARQLFAEQKYAEAAEELQRAYAYDAKSLYLFNAGTAYRKAERRTEALDLYQRYLEVAPDGQLAAEARTYVNDLRALLAAQERLSGTAQLLETERAQSQQKQVELEQALRQERRKPVYKRPWFIATATAVGIVAVVAIGFAGYLQNKKMQSQITITPAF